MEPNELRDDSVFDSDAPVTRRMSATKETGFNQDAENRYKKSILKPAPIMSSSPHPDIPPKPHFLKKSDNQKLSTIQKDKFGISGSDGRFIETAENDYYDQFKKVENFRFVQNVGHFDDEDQLDDFSRSKLEDPPTPTFAPHLSTFEKSVKPSIVVRNHLDALSTYYNFKIYLFSSTKF